jgi:ASC-1-like (ASCH) protein
MEHELKIYPKYFEDVILGKKTFEIRKNDRKYCVGDVLLLKEWDKNIPDKKQKQK